MVENTPQNWQRSAHIWFLRYPSDSSYKWSCIYWTCKYSFIIWVENTFSLFFSKHFAKSSMSTTFMCFLIFLYGLFGSKEEREGEGKGREGILIRHYVWLRGGEVVNSLFGSQGEGRVLKINLPLYPYNFKCHLIWNVLNPLPLPSKSLQYWRGTKLRCGGILLPSIPLPTFPKYWTKQPLFKKIPPLPSPLLHFPRTKIMLRSFLLLDHQLLATESQHRAITFLFLC